MKKHSGLLVVFEGVNGSGKTTIIEELEQYYRMTNAPYAIYKMPDRSGMYGDRIDEYLKGKIVITSKYDVLDMFAANRSAIRKNMMRDLYNGKIVLCDRYVFSAIAYQIPTHVVDETIIQNYSSVIGHFDKMMPMPDVVYLIDGNHLSKRGEAHKEKFHYDEHKSKLIKDKLIKVIETYTDQLVVLRNRSGSLNEVVNYIVFDISTRTPF